MAPTKMNPVAAGTADGVRDASRGALRSEHSTTAKANKASLTVRLDDRTLTVEGRLAQTLALLMQCGSRGFTSGEASPLGWARRTSHYVHELRQLGFLILTQWEDVGDARVGRYVLSGPVAVVVEAEAEAEACALGLLEGRGEKTE